VTEMPFARQRHQVFQLIEHNGLVLTF